MHQRFEVDIGVLHRRAHGADSAGHQDDPVPERDPLARRRCLVETAARAVIDAVPATINVKDCDGRYVLVNAAGTNIPRRSLAELSLADYHAVIDANLHGSYYCAQAFLPQMRARRTGTIVNIVSEAYDYSKPDEFRTPPHDNDIPYDWTRRDG